MGVSKPAIIRISVVLPQPDGPRIEKNEPEGMSRETFETAVKAPNFLVTLAQLRSYIAHNPFREPVGTKAAPAGFFIACYWLV